MRREQGIGFIGFVLILVGGVIVAWIALQIVPTYMEYMAIKRALTGAAKAESKNASIAEMRKAVERRFEVDSATIKTVSANDIDITKEGENIILSANYSVKVPMIANISACIDFNTTATTR